MSTTTVAVRETAIELNELPATGSRVHRRDARPTARSVRAEEPDPVLAASRAADNDVPDGGYGWVVIVAGAVLTWWAVGFAYCWGVILSALVKEGVSAPSTLSFVGSVTSGTISVLAIITSQLVRSLGSQKTCLLGVTFMALSPLLSSFTVHNVSGLFVTNGLLMGVGSSLCFISVSIVPSQYFSRKRGLANGIVSAGGGLGGATLSIAINAFIERYGPAWTFRLLSLGILVTAFPAAWFIKERVPLRATGLVEWRLLRGPKFLLVFAAGAIGTFPLFVPPFFLPLYSGSIGLSSSTGAALLAGFTFSSGVGRILSGIFCDAIGPLNTLWMSFMLNAISLLVIWPVSTTLAPLVAFAILNGASNGGFFATMPTVVGNVFGSQRVSVAMGMVITGWGGGYLMGAPIAGYLLGAYGGADNGLQAYRPAMYYAGSMALGAGGLVAAVRLGISRKLLQKL
ncbi:MFS general substrate transporter [Thozetella sp. PMI_491]|nr:MFS general substrate transporter [Thozetella sp. PMI_491]